MMDITYTSIMEDGISDTAALNGNWYYYLNGKVTYADTVAKNSNGWWRIENGKVNFNCNARVTVRNKTYTVKNGKVML